MDTTIARTKRSKLVERVSRCAPGSVIVVVAAAGYGKSTFVDQLQHRLDGCVYLGLAPYHDDPPTFVRAVLEVLGLDITVPLPDADAQDFVDAVVAGVGDGTLIVDDLHLVSNRVVIEAVSQIAWAVSSGRTVVVSRRLPAIGVARLKVRRRVQVVDDDELALDADESFALVSDLAPGVVRADVETAIGRMEGWPAGLVLFGLTMRSRPLGAMSVHAVRADISEYIRDEVLADLDVDLRLFLLELTLIGVFDRDLARRVTGRDDADELLDELLVRRLFIEPDRSRPGWMRFHDVFGEILRAEGVAEGIAARDLQQRAYELLVAAGDMDLAVDMIASIADVALVARLIAFTPVEMYCRVAPSGSIASSAPDLPIDALLGDEMALIGALCVTGNAGDPRRSQAITDVSMQQFPWDDPSTNPGMVTLYAGNASINWDNESATTLYEHALVRMGDPGWRGTDTECVVEVGLAGAFLYAERLDEAVEHARIALDLATSLGLGVYVPTAHCVVGIVAVLRSDFDRAATELRAATSVIGGSRTRYDAAFVAGLQMMLALHDDDPDAARRIGIAAISALDAINETPGGSIPWALLAQAEQRLGLASDAAGHLAHVRSALRRSTGHVLLARLADAATVADVVDIHSVEDVVALSDRERTILQLLDSRLTLREIADELYLSVNTVKSHTQSIYRKLGVTTRTEANALLTTRRTS